MLETGDIEFARHQNTNLGAKGTYFNMGSTPTPTSEIETAFAHVTGEGGHLVNIHRFTRSQGAVKG